RPERGRPPPPWSRSGARGRIRRRDRSGRLIGSILGSLLAAVEAGALGEAAQLLQGLLGGAGGLAAAGVDARHRDRDVVERGQRRLVAGGDLAEPALGLVGEREPALQGLALGAADAGGLALEALAHEVGVEADA